MDFTQFLTALFTNGIGAACAGAILWLSWYRETKFLPQMLDTFAAVQNKAQDTFSKVQTETQHDFASRQSELLKTFAELTREERAIYQTWHDENRGRLDVQAIETRELRHSLKDLANAIGLRNAVEEAKKEVAAQKEKTAP